MPSVVDFCWYCGVDSPSRGVYILALRILTLRILNLSNRCYEDTADENTAE